MKISKKTGMLVSFIVGASIFASTAFADMVSQSGYDQLKSAAKVTAESFSEKLNNYTVEISSVVKNDGEVIQSEDVINKYDNVNKVKEDVNKRLDEDKTTHDGYYYSDKNCIIYDDGNGSYVLNEYVGGNKNIHYMFENPFKEDKAKDLEKILDALVGNLKDYAVVADNTDGGKEISGSLTETQIPTIANALISYLYKNEFGNRYSQDNNEKRARLTDDIYVKDGKLKASISKDGLINNTFITGTICGKDKDGNVHNVSIEFLYKLYDINSTVISKPNLEGKKVHKSIINSNENNSEPQITKKCIGKYTNDIVLEKDDKYIKIGERILEITSVDDKTLKGKYHEEYKKEYAETYKDKKDINFDINLAELNKNNGCVNFTYNSQSDNKERGSIYINPSGLGIDFNIQNSNQGDAQPNSSFSRNFDE